MGQLPGPPPDYSDFFNKPDIERLLTGLTDHEFEHFVKYVFEQAGYFVEDTAGQYGGGLDLKLYMAGTNPPVLHAGVSIKHFTPPSSVVTGPQMMHFRGALHGKHGYAVTTSTFNSVALAEAQKEPYIWPIDGAHLLRYMRYIRGTRQGAGADALGSAAHSNHNHGFAPLAPETLLFADTIDRRASDVRVLTVANHKGGVGKTTSALNLAFGLASQGKQVLLVDMDAQANLTRALAYPVAQQAATRYLDEYFAGKCTLADLVSLTRFPPVWLIPSRHQLIHEDKGLTAGGEAELQFARDLLSGDVKPPKAIDGRPFDWIIIDTGPWMGFFTRSALAASRYVVVPVSPGVFADMGIEFIVETVSTMQALTGAPLHILGCLVTQWKDDALNRHLLGKAESVLGLFRIPRIETEIPLDKNNIEKAHLETGQGKAKTLFDRRSAAARAYLTVVEWMLNSVTMPAVSKKTLE